MRLLLLAILTASITTNALPAAAAIDHRDLGRETLAANDGWASLSAGTTGGSSAANNQVYTVHNRRELIAALNNGVYPPPSSTPSSVPKVIYVDGVIDANVDDNNQPLIRSDYYRNGYTLEAYLAAYDPAVRPRVLPSGPLENARVASQQAQQARVRIRVGSNTTIVGVGKNSVIRGAWLDIRGTANVVGSRTNIIVRNLTFLDTYDCFPQWDPTDGSLGNWNSAYDSISLRDSDHVWIDHNTFADEETADSTLPIYFGRLFQVQRTISLMRRIGDGFLQSFLEHDKVMLIGSSDSAFCPSRNKLQ